MSSGSPFGTVPSFADLSPADMADLIARMQQGPADPRGSGMIPNTQGQAPGFGGLGLGDLLGFGGGGQPAGPGAFQPVRGAGDVDPSGRGTGPIDQRRPSIAMNEADAQRLERQQAGPQDLAALGAPQGSPDHLLFGRDGLGGGASGFTGQADPYGSRTVPLPPGRPTDDALAMPVATGAVPFGVNPGPAGPVPPGGRPTSTAAIDSTREPGTLKGPGSLSPPTPVNSFDPLTGQVTSGQPQPLGVPQGAVQPQGGPAGQESMQRFLGATGLTPPAGPSAGAPAGAPAPGAPGAQGSSFMDRFAAGLNSPDFGNFLRSMSIGLLTQRGIPAGIGAGFENYQQSQAGQLKQQLQTFKLYQEQQQQNAARAYVKARGGSAELQELAAASPSSVLSGGLTGLNVQPPANYRLRADGQGYEYIPGSAADPEKIGLDKSAGRDGSFTLSPGQTRYGEDNQPVAASPAAPKELRPGATLYDQKTFQPILTAPPAKPEGFDTETKLRTEFSKQLGSFADVHDGYGRVIAATKQRQDTPGSVSPAADIGLIFGYMKMLDPGSVVREGEYATAKNAAGVPDRVVNAYNKAINGEFLTDRQRQDFIGQADSLYGTARKTAEGVATRYRGLATQYSVDPDRSVYLPEAPTPPRLGGQGQGQGQEQAPAVPQGAPDGTRRAPDGKFYAPDPTRPGRFLEVR